MKIATFGWSNPPLSQIERVNQGFLELGHTITYDNADFIFSNNPLYDDVLNFAAKWPNAKVILNVLDYPRHVNSYPFQILKNQLAAAHAVTSISQNTRNELLKYLNIDSTVIYNPVQPTYRLPDMSRKVFAIYCGRNSDPNKRFSLVVETMKKLGKTEDDLICVGPERPYWGRYLGIVENDMLNLLYNQAKYYICPTKISGAELPMLESAACGCIPIACNDNPTPFEFIDADLIADPSAEALAAKILQIDKNRIEISQQLIQKAPIAYKKLNYLEVSKKILSVYEKIR